jgi:acyl homoserine lactone synthase
MGQPQAVARATSRGTDDFEISVIRLPDGWAKWNLVCDFLTLRKAVFIDEMHWDLPHTDEWEWEQYDALDAVYVVAHRGGEVLGGARLLRTDRKAGVGRLRYSYMIRDAYLGHLPGLPSDICEGEPPVTDTAWELTRLAVRSARLGAAILNATNGFLKEEGAKTCLFLGFPAFMRMARSMGYDPRPMGKLTGNGDGKFLAFQCGVV